MKNCDELRKNLSDVFESALNGTLDHKTVSGLANIAGKMISSAKVQLDYYKLNKQSVRISFLETDTVQQEQS